MNVAERQKVTLRTKRWAAACLAVPASIVAVFAIGEGVGGEEGWWGHLIQLGLVAALVALAWYVPRVGGPLLIGLGGLFVWRTLLASTDRVGEWASLAIIGLPLVASGVLFALAGYRNVSG